MIEVISKPYIPANHSWSNNILNDQQLEMFFANQIEFATPNQKSVLEKENKKNLLGQVFTPHILAKFMVSLFKSDLQQHHRILDPCIGPNTFLSYLDDIDSSIKITASLFFVHFSASRIISTSVTFSFTKSFPQKWVSKVKGSPL